MEYKLTDRSLFIVFIWTAPFLLFANVISFDTKNAIGGIGTNLFVLCLAILFPISLMRAKKRDFWSLWLLFILMFIIGKGLLRKTGGAGLPEIFITVKSYAFFCVHYYLGITYLDSERERLRALKGISWFTIWAAIVGIAHYHFFYNVPFIDLKYATSEFGAILYLKDASIMRFRESSIFFGPNVFAYMLVFGYICYYQTWVVSRDAHVRNSRWHIVLVTLLIAYALVTSDSRSALFLLFIFIMLNVVRQDSSILLRVIVPVALITTAIFLMILSARFSLALALSDPRFAKLIVAYTLLNQAPLNWVIGLPAGSPWDTGDIEFSDNLYAALLLEGGFVLIILLAIFSVGLTRKIAWLSVGASKIDSRFLAAARYSLIFFLFYGFFAIPTSMITLFNYLGLLLGGVSRMMLQRHAEIRNAS